MGRSVGARVWLFVGEGDGGYVGANVGVRLVGGKVRLLGAGEGFGVGLALGVQVGAKLGVSVVGLSDGAGVGKIVGSAVGVAVGEGVGVAVGTVDGTQVGKLVGTSVGLAVGFSVGVCVGTSDGLSAFEHPAAHSIAVDACQVWPIQSLKHAKPCCSLPPSAAAQDVASNLPSEHPFVTPHCF